MTKNKGPFVVLRLISYSGVRSLRLGGKEGVEKEPEKPGSIVL